MYGSRDKVTREILSPKIYTYFLINRMGIENVKKYVYNSGESISLPIVSLLILRFDLKNISGLGAD